VSVDNQGYSDLKGVTAFMGDDINSDVVGHADVTIPMDEQKYIGYFDAYSGVKVGSFFNADQYVYWQEGQTGFEFTSDMKNYSVNFINDSYKSAGLKTKVTSFSGSTGIPLKGAVKPTPRKSSVNFNEAKAAYMLNK